MFFKKKSCKHNLYLQDIEYQVSEVFGDLTYMIVGCRDCNFKKKLIKSEYAEYSKYFNVYDKTKDKPLTEEQKAALKDYVNAVNKQIKKMSF